MTIWDNIYKNYQKGGDAWATLSEEIHPLFKEFLEKENFDLKSIFDIGCGTGKYLEFLKAYGFKTDGIDSSETAVEMTKEKLSSDSVVTCTNMFEFAIPQNKYDLVISIATIHHGTKKQVQGLINKVYAVLVESGKIFMTLPDIESTKKWNTFKDHKEVAPGTFEPLAGPEQGLPHSFYAKEEIEELFSRFTNVQIDLDDRGRGIIRGIK